MTASAFKAYDIRGRVPDELNPELATNIAVAMSALLGPGDVVVGRDVRLSSPTLQAALSRGFGAALTAKSSAIGEGVSTLLTKHGAPSCSLSI